MNLREKHGYTYGASSSFDMRAAAGPVLRRAPACRPTRPSEALKEFFNELNGDPASRCRPTSSRARRTTSRCAIPSAFETTGDISRRLEDVLVYHLPDDYFSKYVQNIQAVTAADVQRVAQKYIQPGQARRRRRRRPEGDRAGHPRAEPRADQDDDDRRGLRPEALTTIGKNRYTSV